MPPEMLPLLKQGSGHCELSVGISRQTYPSLALWESQKGDDA